MTIKQNLNLGNDDDEAGTSIVLGFGPQPMDFFSKAMKVCGKQAVLNQDVARMAGATFAIGMPANLAKLRGLLDAGAKAQVAQDNPGLSPQATDWLASGHRGTSSNTIFSHLTGIDALKDSRPDHPYDPADFRRCQLLLEQVPELKPLLPKMAELSPAWTNLVAAWDDIVAALDAEATGWRDGSNGKIAPKSYQLIKTAIGH